MGDIEPAVPHAAIIARGDKFSPRAPGIRLRSQWCGMTGIQEKLKVGGNESDPREMSRTRRLISEPKEKVKTSPINHLDLMGFYSPNHFHRQNSALRPKALESGPGMSFPGWRLQRNTRDGFAVSSIHMGTCDHTPSCALSKHLAPG